MRTHYFPLWLGVVVGLLVVALVQHALGFSVSWREIGLGFFSSTVTLLAAWITRP